MTNPLQLVHGRSFGSLALVFLLVLLFGSAGCKAPRTWLTWDQTGRSRHEDATRLHPKRSKKYTISLKESDRPDAWTVNYSVVTSATAVRLTPLTRRSEKEEREVQHRVKANQQFFAVTDEVIRGGLPPAGPFVFLFTLPMDFVLIPVVIADRLMYPAVDEHTPTGKTRWVDGGVVSDVEKKTVRLADPGFVVGLEPEQGVLSARKTGKSVTVTIDERYGAFDRDTARGAAYGGLAEQVGRFFLDKNYFGNQLEGSAQLEKRHSSLQVAMVGAQNTRATEPLAYWAWSEGNLSSLIEKELARLVDELVNSQIKQIGITVLDIDTHKPLAEASVKLLIKPGIGKTALRDILTEAGIRRAQKYFSKYAIPNPQTVTTTADGGTVFYADKRAAVRFEVVRDGYHYAQDRMQDVGILSSGTAQESLFIPDGNIGILLSETGSKVRVKIIK